MARRNRQKKSPVAAVCSVLGTLLLIIIVATYLPITIPRAFGYEIYTVISGSMEPAIPTGSLVYVKYIQPEEIQTEDVIAFYGTDADGSIVTHRVVSNSAAMGNFITKGDANSDNDMNPIPYANYIYFDHYCPVYYNALPLLREYHLLWLLQYNYAEE